MGEPGLTVGVKYCGGCNPRYDRVALVEELAAAVPAARFVPARAGEPCGALLVVCGCAAACASTAGLEAPLGRVTVRGREDLPRAVQALLEKAK